MKIVVHDYAGHPFQVQLSRALAARGHEVLHLYCASFLSPRGRLERTADDPSGLDIRGLTLGRDIDKSSFVERRRQDLAYAKVLTEAVARYAPDIVVSANTPPDSQVRIATFCRSRGIRFVFWLQDSFALGVRRVLARKLPVIGVPVAWHYARLERKALRMSDAVVLIAPDFAALTHDAGVAAARVQVIPNWAPLDEVPALPKANDWARAHGITGRFCFMYSGTLGLKHRPELLLRLAESCRGSDAIVLVVSEGAGATWLERQRDVLGLEPLVVLPFQPFDRMPQVLASADVLVGVLEPEAGTFSVPSKVLTYMCAGRALLLGMPAENLAARIVSGSGAGLVVDPTNIEAFVAAGGRLRADASLRDQMGRSARAYAQETFDIGAITDRFESLLKTTSNGTVVTDTSAHVA